MDPRIKDLLYLIINILILADLILIVSLLFFNRSSDLLVWSFDVVVCAIVLLDFFLKLYKDENKKHYLNDQKFVLMGSIPLEFISPIFILLRFMLITRLLKLLTTSKPFSKFFDSWNRFIENTKLDRIVNWILFTVIIFTFVLYFLDPDLNLFDTLWFVVVTLTTVGYGDVVPNNLLAKVISLFLLILGIFIFSTMTGAISSYFTDKVLNIESDAEEDLDFLIDKVDDLEKEVAGISEQLELSRRENRKLHEKIDELLKK